MLKHLAMKSSGVLRSAAATAFVLPVCLALATGAEARQLPGDEIRTCRVVSIDRSQKASWHWEMKLEVSYAYNAAHGKGQVGAGLLPPSGDLELGHSYWGTNSGPDKAVDEHREGDLVVGIQRVSIWVRVKAPQVSTSQIRVYLSGPQGGEFVSRSFPYAMTWRRPDAPEEALPDLVISSGSVEPSGDVPPGTVLHFTFHVTNQGTAAVTGAVVVSGPGNFSGVITGGLKPGETKVAVVDYPVYSRAVTYTMRFMVDPDNIYRESDETNNGSATFVIRTTS